jgi:hypothetical protein
VVHYTGNVTRAGTFNFGDCALGPRPLLYRKEGTQILLGFIEFSFYPDYFPLHPDRMEVSSIGDYLGSH